jgi:multiple sugar transport system permease protein
MKHFFDEMPAEIEDAARVDGCSRIQALWHVVLPLVRPGLAATSILAAISAWNEFLFALLLTTGSGSRTWPVGLQLMVGEFQLPVGQLTAGGVLTLTPVVVAYLLVGRTLVKGLMAGGLKG